MRTKEQLLHELKAAVRKAEANAFFLVPEFALVASALTRVFTDRMPAEAAMDYKNKRLYINSTFLHLPENVQTNVIFEEYLHFLLRHHFESPGRGSAEAKENRELAEIACELEREYVQQKILKVNWCYPTNFPREKTLLAVHEILCQRATKPQDLTLEQIFKILKHESEKTEKVKLRQKDIGVDVDEKNILYVEPAAPVDSENVIDSAVKKLAGRTNCPQLFEISASYGKHKVLLALKKILRDCAYWASKKDTRLNIFELDQKKTEDIVFYAKQKTRPHQKLFVILDVSLSMIDVYTDLLGIALEIKKEFPESIFFFADTEIREVTPDLKQSMCIPGGGGTELDAVTRQLRTRPEYTGNFKKIILFVSDFVSNFEPPLANERFYGIGINADPKSIPQYIKLLQNITPN